MDFFNQRYVWVIIAAVLLAAFICSIIGNKKRLPYVKAENLLTKNERECYKLLRKFADKYDYDVFCKVRLADMVLVEKGTKEYMKWFNKIKSKHIDFVICNAYETDPVLLLELDDRSHLAKDRIERDDFVDAVCKKCGINIVHIYRSDFSNIEKILKEYL